MHAIRSLVVISVLLTVACGGTKIEIANDMGKDIMLLSVDVNGEFLEWSSIENEDTVSGSMTIPESPVPPVVILEWDDGLITSTEEFCLLDSAATAKKIWIHLSPDAVSLSYSF